MSTKRKVLLVVAVLFTLVNLGGMVIAGVAGEGAHTAVHVALTVVGALGVATLVRPRRGADERLPH